jgi:hypothetical protein
MLEQVAFALAEVPLPLRPLDDAMEHCRCNAESRKAGELAREVFCSRDTVLLSGLIITLIWNNNVNRHSFLWPAEFNANRNETLFPAACDGRIDIHRRDVHVPPM